MFGKYTESDNTNGTIAELLSIMVVCTQQNSAHSRIFQHGAYTFRTREGAKQMRIARKLSSFSL